MRNQTRIAWRDNDSIAQAPNDSGVQISESADAISSGRQITLRSQDWCDPGEDAALAPDTKIDLLVASVAAVSDSLVSHRIDCTCDPESEASGSIGDVSLTFAADPSVSDDIATQFQLSLRPDQLARLWLREPSLNPNNVFAWSAKEGKWVSALRFPQVASQIAKERMASVLRWSALCASRVSASIATPPQRPRLPQQPLCIEESIDFEQHLAVPRFDVGTAWQTQPRYESAITRLPIRIQNLLAALITDLTFWSGRLIRRLRNNPYCVRFARYFGGVRERAGTQAVK